MPDAFDVSSPDDAARALRRVNVDGAADDAIDDVVKVIKRLSAVNLLTLGARFPKSRTTIKRRGGKLTLEAPWAFGAEYGATTHPVFGRTRQIAQYPKMRGLWPRRVTVGLKTGHVVGKAWRQFESRAADSVADDVLDEYSSEFDKAGLLRGFG